MVSIQFAVKTVIITMLIKQSHLSHNVGLNIKYYETDFATLKVMIIQP